VFYEKEKKPLVNEVENSNFFPKVISELIVEYLNSTDDSRTLARLIESKMQDEESIILEVHMN